MDRLEKRIKYTIIFNIRTGDHDKIMNKKRTVAEMSTYFNGEVERFSNLERGQESIKDARLMMDLLAETASALLPEVRELLDIGCGAGNQTLNLLKVFPSANCTLLDISPSMLERAKERVEAAAEGKVSIINRDFRTAELPEGGFDLIVAAAVLHHLRDDSDWTLAFSKIHSLLKPGGVLRISDLIKHDNPKIEALFKVRQEKFLRETLGDSEAERMMLSIQESDTPSSLEYQFALLRKIGFREVGLLHKNLVFGAYYARK